MTVCIALACDYNNAIVAVSDKKISSTAYSADALVSKFSMMSIRWWAMWAASDISQVAPILRNARPTDWESETLTLDEIETLLVDAFHKHLKEVCTHRYLARFGLTMERFLAEGAKTLPPEAFMNIFKKIQEARLECTFLGFGFDPIRKARLFVLSDQGLISEADPLAFAAIGSGAYGAESILFFNKYRAGASIPEAVYQACEAKFIAESASDVGEETLAFVVHKDGGGQPLFDEQIKEIRALWESEGKPRKPREMEQKVTALLDQAAARVEKFRSEQDSKDPPSNKP
jgi:20S proteasome alpha/beta subunit